MNIAVYNTRTRERDISLPVIWESANSEYVVVRTGIKAPPYSIYHRGNGKLVPAPDTSTQKRSFAFAQWFEDEKFFDETGKALASLVAIRRGIAAWVLDTTTG